MAAKSGVRDDSTQCAVSFEKFMNGGAQPAVAYIRSVESTANSVSPWRLSVAPMMDWTDELLSTYCSKPFADVAVWIALQLHFEG